MLTSVFNRFMTFSTKKASRSPDIPLVNGWGFVFGEKIILLKDGSEGGYGEQVGVDRHQIMINGKRRIVSAKEIWPVKEDLIFQISRGDGLVKRVWDTRNL